MEDTRLKKIILIVTIVMLGGFWLSQRPYSLASDRTGLSLKYRMETLDSHAEGALPLVIALHGNGDKTGNFFDTLFEGFDGPARIVLIQGPLTYGPGYAWPMAGNQAETWGETLADVVLQLTERYGEGRNPVLVGFSGGACMAFYQAALHPELYASVLALSGHLPASFCAKAPDDTLPVFVLHGKNDSIIAFQRGSQAASCLSDAGRTVTFTALDGDHLSVFLKEHNDFLATLDLALSGADR